jgi:predicted secreted protein
MHNDRLAMFSRRLAAVGPGTMVVLLALVVATGGSVAAQRAQGCQDSDDVTAPITVQVGEQFVVGLTAIPSTGNSWELDDPELGGLLRKVNYDIISLVPTPLPTATPRTFVGPGGSMVYEASPFRDVITGGAGRACWTFEAVASGRLTLAMSYRRGWEPLIIPPARTKQFTVIVAPAGAPVQIPSAALADELPG